LLSASCTRVSPHTRAVAGLTPTAITRESVELPYVLYCPALVHTSNHAGPLLTVGPLPTEVCEMIFVYPSISVRYSAPSAPYVPLTSTRRIPSRHSRSFASSMIARTAPSCARVCGQRWISEVPPKFQSTPSRPLPESLLYIRVSAGSIPAIPGGIWIPSE
jgi:hypothetical protein